MSRQILSSHPQPPEVPLAHSRPAPVRFQRAKPARHGDKPFIFTDFASI